MSNAKIEYKRLNNKSQKETTIAFVMNSEHPKTDSSWFVGWCEMWGCLAVWLTNW